MPFRNPDESEKRGQASQGPKPTEAKSLEKAPRGLEAGSWDGTWEPWACRLLWMLFIVVQGTRHLRWLLWLVSGPRWSRSMASGWGSQE